jgi:hypothetical protein
VSQFESRPAGAESASRSGKKSGGSPRTCSQPASPWFRARHTSPRAADSAAPRPSITLGKHGSARPDTALERATLTSSFEG